MKLINPPWVSHDGGAIYSLDVHPYADKIVTCGQGDIGGNGLIVVWNSIPILNEDRDKNIPKILARIQHQAGVNCVRWSTDGTLLAAASDDKVVTVYEYGGRVKSSGTIGSKEILAVEKYRIVHNMHMHTMEVLSVEWSDDGRFLASGSMDNTVIIWNAKRLPEKVIVLDHKRDGHTAPVKGISWDPIGKYIATQSADKTVKCWKTDNWQCEKTVSEPFVESGQTTMFSRLGWAADGQFLFAPCAMNNQGPVCQIIRRKDWDSSMDLVGHRKAVTVVKVSKRLLHYVDYSGKKMQVSLLAVGSRDKSLSVWVFPLVKRPVIVMTRIFKHSIMDITWKGLDLVVCSQDGSVKYFVFSVKELGDLASIEQMGTECELLYKSKPPQFCEQDLNCATPGKLNSTFIDTAEQLVAKRKAEEATMDVDSTKSSFMEKIDAIQKRKTEELLEKRKEQVETRTNDGKRRIQPIFLASTVDDEPPATSVPATSTTTTTTTTVQASSNSEPTTEENVVTTGKVVAGKQSPPPKKTRLELTTDDSTADDSSDDCADITMSDDESAKDASAQPSSKGPAEQMMRADFKKPSLRLVDNTHIAVSDANTVLDTPEQKSTLTETVIGLIGDTVDIQNEWACTGTTTSKLTYTKKKEHVWSAFVGPPVAIVAANRLWTVVGCFDRTVRVYASTSGRLQSCLQLDSVPVRVGLNGNKMFALTQTGRFSSWDVEKCKALLSRQPISDCVSKDANLTSISLSPLGMPLIGFSTGNLFTFSTDMQCWHLVDSSSSVLRLCDSIEPYELGDGQLGKILKKRKRGVPALKVPAGVRSSVTENQLESWLASALITGCSTDYRRLLMTYAQQLIKDKSTIKLKELLTKFEGNGLICGLQKNALRQDIEDIVKTDPILATMITAKRNTII
ncbi:unnamed protein product [Auanema sp. JU1783]|nr:unnamed protein product [Auanema sp. JU1783]